MTTKPSKRSRCHEDNLRKCAELGWMFCSQESVVIHKQELTFCQLSTQTHTHTPTPLTAICISASVRPFPDQNTSIPLAHTHRKWPVRFPNKLMCHAFLSDISAKAQEGGCSNLCSSSSSSSPPVLVRDRAVTVTALVLL